ncbi:glycosyltransferase family 4 protein [Cyclobacterium sp. SYSU L10401]|uniref:glycosyltransferase family 4 protein n=1 Tax=Cyclobacterium sp. SYSU L10401 TaxID=2678657 RepID=UPI0013D4ACFA|nr:glycosyltransferase family 4 protein [Cyclobacterium sp. SYSU L10401]
MKVKKVAFLLNEFPTLTETFILNQITFLIAKGIDVHIFSLYQGDFDQLHSQFQKYKLENKVTYVANICHSPLKRWMEATIFLNKEGFMKNIGALIKCVNPFYFGISGFKFTYFLYYSKMYPIKDYDLVHAHFGIMGAFFARFTKIGLFKNMPFLVSFHGYDLTASQRVKSGKLYRKMFRNAKLITVNSRYSSKMLMSSEKDISLCIKILPMGVNTRFFNSPNFPKTQGSQDRQRFRMICVGRLISLKGADRALDILEILIKKFGLKNVDLVIIGEGPLRLKLEQVILEKRLKRNVHLLGARSQIEIKEELAGADLFIYPGRREVETGRAEAQGLVILEAQAMGLPIVAFDVGGISEGIQNNETGILVPPEDIDEFANCVTKLLLNPDQRKEMGKKAREFVVANFDIEILGQRLLDIYEEVLE